MSHDYGRAVSIYPNILCDVCKVDISDDSYSLPDGRWTCWDCWNGLAP